MIPPISRKSRKTFPTHAIVNGACTCGKSCTSPGKHPLTAHGVKDASADPATLTKFFTGPYEIANVAVATGEPSAIWVIDEDVPGSLDALAYGRPLPRTVTARTGGGGRHVYFRFDERVANVKNAVRFAPGLDIRTTGGYVLLPPANHTSGGRYAWIESPDACEVADAPAWLVDTLPRRDEDATTRVETQTTRVETSTSRDDTTLSRGENVSAGGVVNVPSTPKSDRGEGSDAPASAPVGTLTLTETDDASRLRAYLRACPPAVSGERGHDRTFATCCRVVELFGLLPDDAIVSALDAWNARCEPPWTDSELRRKLRDARQRTGIAGPEAETPPEAMDIDADAPPASPHVDAAAPSPDVSAIVLRLLTTCRDAIDAAIIALTGDAPAMAASSSVCDTLPETHTATPGVAVNARSVGTLTLASDDDDDETPDAPSHDDGSVPLDADDFIASFSAAVRGEPPPPIVGPTATLAEVFDWRNADGVAFAKRADGSVGVSDESTTVPPAIARALTVHAETLAALVCNPMESQTQTTEASPAPAPQSSAGSQTTPETPPQASGDASSSAETATLVDVFDFLNAHGVRLGRRADRSIWVTDETTPVPPPIARAFVVHADALAPLVDPPAIPPPSPNGRRYPPAWTPETIRRHEREVTIDDLPKWKRKRKRYAPPPPVPPPATETQPQRVYEDEMTEDEFFSQLRSVLETPD